MGKAGQSKGQAKRARPASEMSAPRPGDRAGGAGDDTAGAPMLTAFSADATLFAALSPAVGKDRLRVWAVTSAPPSKVAEAHSAHAEILADVVVPDAQTTTLVWVDVPASNLSGTPSKGKKNKKKNRASGSNAHVALGTHDGRVLLFNSTQGEFTLILSDAQFSPSAAGVASASGECRVTGVSSNEGTLYVSSADGLVRWYNVATASTSTIAPIKRLLPSHAVRPQVVATAKAGLIVAEHEIQLYSPSSLDAAEPIQGVARSIEPWITYTGHSTPVTHICWLGPQRFLSAAQDDRTVYVWEAPQGLAPAHGGVPQGIITLDAPVRTLISAGTDPHGSRRVVIVDTAGLASVYVVPLSLDKKSEQPPRRRKSKGGAVFSVRPVSSVRVVTAATGDGKVLPILSVGPDASSTQGFRLVTTLARMVRGAKLALDTVLLHSGDKDAGFAPSVEVVRTKELLAESATGSGEAPNVGRFAPKSEAVQLADEPKSKKSKPTEKVAAVGSSGGAPLAELGLTNVPTFLGEGVDAHADVEELDEPSLAARLKGLKMPQPTEVDETSAQRALGQFDGAGVSQALTQALHSQDQSLTTELLLVAKLTVPALQASVARLTGPLAVRLLEASLDRLEVSGTRLNSGRTNRLVEWIRAVLISHSGYLMSLPSLLPRLFQVHAALSGRLAHRERLTRMQGRLELVLAQIDTKAEHASHLQIPGVSQDRHPAGPGGVPEGDVWIEPDEEDDEVDAADEEGEVDDILPDQSDLDEDMESDSDDGAMDFDAANESDPEGDSDAVESTDEDLADSENDAPAQNRRKPSRSSRRDEEESDEEDDE